MDYTKPFECKAYGCKTSQSPLEPLTITRRGATPSDVVIEIKYAGICHSDIHTMREEWGPIKLPLVVGHEIVGTVVSVGSNVTKFQPGATVGVGCMVDSCRSCSSCFKGDEQYCLQGMVGTYGSDPKYPHCAEYNPDPSKRPHTLGGYSQYIVVDESFVLNIPTNLDLAGAAPLLCAGITTYSPLMHYGLKPNHKLAVLGLGGLGHMAVKFGIAFGAHVTVISRGTGKKESSLNSLKAHAYLDSTDADAMAAAAGSFDIILNTISAKYDIAPYINLLKHDGKMVVVGGSPYPMEVYSFPLLFKRISIGGSLIGGIKETQEMLDFCGRHNITCDIEQITPDKVNEAWERTLNADVKYRFVIDVSKM